MKAIIGMNFGTTKKTDWILTVFKLANILGTMMHCLEIHDGELIDTLVLAFEMIKKNPTLLEGSVTHKYRIDDYKTAFDVAANKGKNSAIKVAFDLRK